MDPAVTGMTAAVAIDEPAASRESTPRGELREEQTLAALPSAAGAARRFVRHTLTGWQIDRDRAGRIESAVQALVIHSVATTGVSSSAPLYRDDYDRLQLIVVRLRLGSGLLVAEVWDRTDTPPHPQLGEDAAVRATDEHDYAVPLPRRRVVRCAVHMAALPRRVPRPVRPPPSASLSPAGESVTEPGAVPTADLHRRVLGGLRHLGSDPP